MILIAATLIGWGFTIGEYWYGAAPISIGFLFIIIIIFVSLADYLDIIELRKSVVRHTKCIICGRTNEPNSPITSPNDESNDGVITEMTKTFRDKKSGSEVITKHKPEPEIKLTGLIVNNKVVCIECVKIIKELVK